jgi:hypothetical protein
MEYNLTSKDKIHKYTINLPHDLFLELIDKCKSSGFNELAPYLRAIIYKEIRGGNFTIDDLFSKRKVSEINLRRELKTITHKKEGFIKLGIKKISNLFNPKQHIFDWKSPTCY